MRKCYESPHQHLYNCTVIFNLPYKSGMLAPIYHSFNIKSEERTEMREQRFQFSIFHSQFFL